MVIRKENFNIKVTLKTDKKVEPGQITLRNKLIEEHNKKLAEKERLIREAEEEKKRLVEVERAKEEAKLREKEKAKNALR